MQSRQGVHALCFDNSMSNYRHIAGAGQRVGFVDLRVTLVSHEAFTTVFCEVGPKGLLACEGRGRGGAGGRRYARGTPRIYTASGIGVWVSWGC